MKKHLLSGLTLFLGLGVASVMAAPPFEPEDIVLEVKRDNGTTNNSNKWCNTWTSSATAPQLSVVTKTAANALTAAMQWHGTDGITGDEAQYFHLYAQNASQQPVSVNLNVSGNADYYISGYTLKAKYYNPEAAGTTTLTVNGQTYEFTGATEEQTISVTNLPKGTTTTAFQVTGANNPLKIYDFYVTLSTRDTNAAGMPYFARELDNLNLKLYVNESNRYLYLNDDLASLGHANNSADRANVWHAEYVTKTAEDGTDLSGLRLSSKGVYLGKMPNAKSEFVNVTTNPEDAGLWRFFAEGTAYGLSCSEQRDGTIINLIGFGGAEEVNKNAWLQIGGTGVQRWGVWPNAAHWNVVVVNDVEFILDCDGVTVTGSGVPGETIAATSLTGLPDFFVPEAVNVTIPAAGETLTIHGEWQLPFSFDTPYYLNLKQNNTGTYHNVYYKQDGQIVNKDIDAAHRTLNPRLVWYFKDGGIENNAKVITLHSLATDENLGVTATATNGSNCGIGETPTKFAIGKNGNSFTLRIADATNAYINEFGNGGKMAIWNDAGAKNNGGSCLWAISLTDEDFDVTSWIADDEFTYTFDAEKLETAKSEKTLEALRDLFVYVPKTQMTREDVIARIATDANYTNVVNRLTNSGLFDADAASAAVYNLLAVPEESDDFDAVLTEKIAALANITAAAIITDYINGKKVAFRNYSGNGRIKMANDANKITTARNNSAMVPEAVWAVSVVDANAHTFTLQNMVDGKYANGLDATADASLAMPYQLVNEGVLNSNTTIGALAIKATTSTDSNPFWNDNTSNNQLQYKAAGSSNGSSFWYIDLVTEETEQGFVDAIDELIPAIGEGMTLGNLPGQFSVSDENYEAKRERVEALKESFDYAEAYELFNTPAVTFTLFDMHSIEGTALIRIKDYTGNYMVHNGGFAAKDEADDETIFVIENDAEGNAAVSSLGGHYLTVPVTGDKTFLRIFPGVESDDINNNVPTTIKFFNNYPGLTDGAYAIGFVNGHTDNNSTKCILASVDDAYNHYSDTDYRTDVTAEHIRFNIEYVETLRVNVEANGYKLWRAPVAVNFGDLNDTGAYTVSVSGSTITTTAAEASTTYGAGTMFILTKDAVFNVDNAVVADAQTAGLGHHAVKQHNLTAGKVYLTVHADQTIAEPETPEIEPALFYDAPELPKLKMAVTIPAEDTAKILGAHEAVIEADKAAESKLEDGGAMVMSLGGSTETTQISEITVEAANGSSVYDLQGRKLAAPAKGINIVNGKKVLVK